MAGMLIAVQMIMPATGRSVMVSEIVRAIIFWILFIYIDVKVLKKGKKKKFSDKGIRIAIVIMSMIFCGWISKGIVMDLIHGPESLYSILEGGTPSEKLCLVHEDEWRIYYSERGGRTGERAYPTEDEACEVFLRMLKRSAEK